MNDQRGAPVFTAEAVGTELLLLFPKLIAWIERERENNYNWVIFWCVCVFFLLLLLTLKGSLPLS